VTHQQRRQLQQKLADAGLDLMHLERFIGYASNGQKQMNGNQLHSYLFNSPVQAVAGAGDGDPNSPSTFISGWDVTISPTHLSTLCPWL
jgi:predicted mannosyl-3-phosphoglycerate phosphatase (HAD superfamily)